MGFGSLYIPVSGMNASKYSLNTVSHNITNSNNPKYVRQSAMHGTNRYENIRQGIQVGTGVNVNQIRQIRDRFLDIQLRNELPEYGYHYAKAETLGDIESVFNEITASGLQDTMNDFWDNWNELHKDPESLTARALVYEGAVAFADRANHLGDQLIKVQRNLNSELEGKVHEVNDLIEGVADLNKKIVIREAEGPHISANDLRDERNAIIDRLSQLIPIQEREDPKGGSVISIRGQELVDGSFVTKLTLKPNEKGFGELRWANTNEKIDLKGKGEIGGFIDVRDKSVVEYMDRADMLIKGIADKVNELHRGGQGIDAESTTGLDFFVARGGGEIRADNIQINPELIDLNKIAISENGQVGDGEIARKIYELRDSTDMLFKFDTIKLDEDGEITGEPISIDDFYRDTVSTLGLERKASITIFESQNFLIKSIDGKRASLSSVSLDEEMADMLKFQHAYTANTRVFNTIDEMLDIIVNRVGIVGR